MEEPHNWQQKIFSAAVYSSTEAVLSTLFDAKIVYQTGKWLCFGTFV